MSEMVRIIRNDPALTAKVLRICNSRFYGMPGRVESLNMALVVLGMREMSNLVICLSIFKVFPEAGERFWKNSVACGSIARTIITKLNVRFHGIEYMAGLLHNVGGLLLEKHFPTEFSKSLFVKAAILQQGMDPDMVLIENEIIGCDHAEVGSWLMEEWGLPKLLVDACRFHHQPSYAPKDSMLIAAIVGLAGLISTPMISEVELDYNDLLKMVSESDQWMVIIKEHPEMSNIDLIEFMEKLYPISKALATSSEWLLPGHLSIFRRPH